MMRAGLVAIGLLTAFGLGCTGKGGGGGGSSTPVEKQPDAPPPAATVTSTTTATDTSAATDGDDTDTGGMAGTLALNLLEDSFPRGLAIAALQPVVTERVAASAFAGAVALETSLKLQEPPAQPAASSGPSQAEVLATQDELLTGEADTCLDAGVLEPAVANEPSGDTCFNDGQLRYAFGGLNEAIDSANTEPCVVLTSRRHVERARQLLDTATKIQLGMLCQVAKDGTEVSLPAVGETLDLVEAMTAAIASDPSIKNGEVEFASIKRLEDENGAPVYRTDVKVSKTQVDPGGNVTGTSIKELHLVHSPAEDDSGNYRGVIWMVQSTDNAAHAKVHFGVSYAKTGTAEEPRLKFEVRKFDWNGSAETPLPTGLLDMSAGANFSVPSTDPGYGMFDGVFGSGAQGGDHNAIVTNIRYLNFDINPLDGAGSVAVWTNDGNYKTAARGLVTTFARGSDDLFQGCSVAGAAAGELSVRMALKDGPGLTLPSTSFEQEATGLVNGQTTVAGADVSSCKGVTKLADVDPAGGQPETRNGLCYVKNGALYLTATGTDTEIVAAANMGGCTELKVLAEDTSPCQIQFTGQTVSTIYMQCFKQTADGKYGLDSPDGSGEQIMQLAPAAAAAAPFNVAEPDLAEVTTFEQDVRP
jgi:hypothetical protein